MLCLVSPSARLLGDPVRACLLGDPVRVCLWLELFAELSSHGVHGAMVYSQPAVELLQACHAEAHSLILHAYTQPDVDVVAGVASLPHVSSATSIAAAEGGASPAGEIDPAIESFKEMIRAQDEQLHTLKLEVGQLRDRLTSAQGELCQMDGLRAELAEARAALATQSADAETVRETQVPRPEETARGNRQSAATAGASALRRSARHRRPPPCAPDSDTP